MNAEIIAVGTELLLGNIANTDAQDVSQMLSRLGINVFFHTVVGDNPRRVMQAAAAAKQRADIIITTGGLGPTYDDLTKQTIAEAFGKKLVFHEDEYRKIKEKYSSVLYGMEMPENNARQAWLPEGCTVLDNSCGTAPGCAFQAEGKTVIMLPGPPRECRAMLKTGAEPYLAALTGVTIRSHNIHIFGMGESAVETQLRSMMTSMTNPTLAPYAKDGEVMLRLTARAASEREAEEMMAPALEKIKEEMGSLIYGIDTDSLENTVLSLLIKNNVTLSAAESCTGGLFSKRITDIPGASQVFFGGAVTYKTESKTEILSVPKEVIEKYGVVSHETASSMARCVREKFGTDLGVGITGYAGPDGEAVGTVYAALADRERVFCAHMQGMKDRERIRRFASSRALDMLRRYLTGLPVE